MVVAPEPGALPPLLLAHLVGWFGDPEHIDVGYTSSDPDVLEAQVDQAIALGLDGFTLDWYGPAFPTIDLTAERLLDAAEGRSFHVALMLDYGALPDGDAATDVMIGLIEDAHARFFSRYRYLRHGGRPVLLTFGKDGPTPDLAAVRAAADALEPSPLLFDLHPDEDAAPHVDGFYAWVTLEGDWGEPYLTWFYDTAGSLYPDHLAIAMEQAVIDKDSAWTAAQSLTEFDDGNSKTNTLYWIATRP